jgi:hypothetical protein
MDNDIFARIEKGDFKREELRDVFPGRPYHVQFMGSSEENWISVVLVDLDRDGKWDERWEMKPEGVTRRVINKEEEEEGPETTPFALRPGRWLPY